MALAPDGKKYDVDNLKRRPGPTEVEVIQFVRPKGKRRKLFFDVSEDTAQASREMVLSADVDAQNIVSMYVRWKDEPDESEAVGTIPNVKANISPADVVMKLVALKLAERKREGGEKDAV